MPFSVCSRCLQYLPTAQHDRFFWLSEDVRKSWTFGLPRGENQTFWYCFSSTRFRARRHAEVKYIAKLNKNKRTKVLIVTAGDPGEEAQRWIPSQVNSFGTSDVRVEGRNFVSVSRSLQFPRSVLVCGGCQAHSVRTASDGLRSKSRVAWKCSLNRVASSIQL